MMTRPAHGNRRTTIARISAIVVALVMLPVSASALELLTWYRDGFLGLWRGVDPLDGSDVEVSITDIERDGALEISQREGFFTSCANLGSNYSLGRGKVVGTGTVLSKTELEVTTTFICINDLGVPDTTPPAGTVIYTLESHGKILSLPPFGQSPGILLHRIAR
jgi:hypothetical protein